jgi:hypothetical protein
MNPAKRLTKGHSRRRETIVRSCDRTCSSTGHEDKAYERLIAVKKKYVAMQVVKIRTEFGFFCWL